MTRSARRESVPLAGLVWVSLFRLDCRLKQHCPTALEALSHHHLFSLRKLGISGILLDKTKLWRRLLPSSTSSPKTVRPHPIPSHPRTRRELFPQRSHHNPHPPFPQPSLSPPLTTPAERGTEYPLSQLSNKVVLVVNTASKCGFTPQFAGLEKLYKDLKAQYPNDFEIIGFPCNQFGGQDPGSNDEIQEFCQLNYGVSFPVLGKIDVSAPLPIHSFTPTPQGVTKGGASILTI